MNKIFLDLDGTLARFNVPNALQRFEKEKGFFLNLKPYKNIEKINALAESGNVYIISASPNLSTDVDKKEWIKKHLPNLPIKNIVLCRIGENKAKAISNKLGFKIDKTCFLLDDYTKNLKEWENAGGVGIKRITSVADNSTKKWQGLEIKDLSNLINII